jgi:hypothetical protein
MHTLQEPISDYDESQSAIVAERVDHQMEGLACRLARENSKMTMGKGDRVIRSPFPIVRNGVTVSWQNHVRLSFQWNKSRFSFTDMI